MDSATQFLLGASVSAVMLGPKLGPRAVLLGGVVATLPDLDSFLPAQNALDSVTYHRGFSHSLFVQTAVSPFIALSAQAIFKKTNLNWYWLWFTVWLCLITHSLLDCLTTYGTQIFWPLNIGSPVAIPSVFIIDPFYTSLLLIGVITFVYMARRNAVTAARVIRLCLLAGTVYLGFGLSAHMIVKERAQAHPLLWGKKIHVQPTPFNILYWQILAVDETYYYSGATSVLRGCSLVNLKKHPRIAKVDELAKSPSSVERFEWFTNGFYNYKKTENGLQISDLRIGFAPFYPFSYQFAQKIGAKYQVTRPFRVKSESRSLAYLTKLYGLAKVVPSGCW